MIDLLKEEKSYPELLNHTFYYLDPPYLNNKARYKKNSETLEFHEELTKVIDGIPYIMISGYDNEIYERNLVEKLHFHKYVFAEKVENIENVKAGGMRPERIEVIWTSYELQVADAIKNGENYRLIRQLIFGISSGTIPSNKKNEGA